MINGSQRKPSDSLHHTLAVVINDAGINRANCRGTDCGVSVLWRV